MNSVKLPVELATVFAMVNEEFRAGAFQQTNSIRDRVAFMLNQLGIHTEAEFRCDFYHAKRDRMRKGRIDLHVHFKDKDYYFEFDKGLGNTKSIQKLQIMRGKNPNAVCVHIGYKQATKEVMYSVY